ncbi:partner and localizer of BRCA2 [Heteronotia binoei]|uniref:partner and localizer of BRCA2 n=1 Tax=Heteronotia binoei TaxID=13085 RepID=UPI002931CE98|nr:partner and localizer of BRCA2 [Heteronotia binoei]
MAALSARDKEKLKEKLAVLERQYRKTFKRLQRAERAEKVKSYVKKTVAEQNSLLLQAAAEEGPADSTRQGAPEGSKSIPAGSCPKRSAVKTPSVTFSLEPEVFSRESDLPVNSGSECTEREHEGILGGTMQPIPGKNRSRLSRSRRRGRESVASEESRDVARDGEELGHKGAGWEGSQSPVFTRRGSGLELDPSIPRTPSAGAQGSSAATPQLEDVQGPLGGNVIPGGLSPLPGYLLEESWGPSLEHPWKEGTFALPEVSAVEDTGWLADVQHLSKEKEGGREDEADVGRTAPQESGGGAAPPRGESQSSRHCKGDSPAAQPAKANSGGGAEAASPLFEGVSPAAPTRSLLDSCTVVEGLLFPVEYYVRTTRRMASRQRELNLAAVIQSQLGTRRRSQRASPKDRVASPAPSSQGLSASPPEASQGGGSGSPLPSNEGPGEGMAPSRRGRRKGRGRPRRTAASRGAREPLASVGLPSSGARGSEPREQAENQSGARVEPAPEGTPSLHQSESLSTSLERQAGRTSPGGRGSRPCGAGPGPPSLSSLNWLPTDLALCEFHLPADEFGLLQSEKVRASTAKVLEIAGAGESPEDLQGADDAVLQTAEERPGDVLLSPEDLPAEPALGLHTSKLLLSPAHVTSEGGSPQQESQLPTPLFPMVGATPATQGFGDSPQQVPATSPPEPSARAVGKPACGMEEEQCHPRTLCPEDEGGALRKQDEAAVSLGARQELVAESEEPCGASADQQDAAAGGPAQAPGGRQGEGNLQLISKLKNPTGSCPVDMSTVWWEVADFTELCIVTACETSVALWRRLDSGCWETIHTWSFAEVPVFQLIPLPGAHSLVCVALGGLEIAELRLLFHSPEEGCLKQLSIKAGNITAVLGLSGQRLVTSCDGAVEVLSFSEAGGGCRRQALFPPEETVSAFAAVDGMAEALVGLTAANCVVVWNLSSGQLLCRMPLGYTYPAPVCHQASSDSGLLFVVLSHPCAKEEEVCSSPAFQLVAFNPKTARSVEVMVASLPSGLQGRYLEGDVRDTCAAAVLASGVIAVWDLPRGECTALLPPSAEGSWSLVRWSLTDRCLLAGQTDGSVWIYAARPGSGPEHESSWA